MNPVVAYLAANHERLGLDRLGLPPRPTCLVLTPRFRLSRHVVVLVLAPGRREPVLVAKLPRIAGDGGALLREAANLRAVARALEGPDVGTVPALVAFEERADHPLLLETALAGRPLSPAVVRRERQRVVADVAAWLERLALATAERPRDDAWYERVVVAPLHALAGRGGHGAEVAEMAERTLELAAPLRSADLPLVLEHGDLGHPNLLRQPDGRLGVLDWERGDPAGLPLHDLFFFLAYAAMASGSNGRHRGRLAGVRAAFFGPTAWAWPVVRRHADALAIDAGLPPALMAVSCARAVEAADAPALLRRGAARDAAARHLLLWRHALDDREPGLHPLLTPTTTAEA